MNILLHAIRNPSSRQFCLEIVRSLLDCYIMGIINQIIFSFASDYFSVNCICVRKKFISSLRLKICTNSE